MQSISVFLEIAKFADFQWRYPDVSRTQEMCHMIHIFFGFSLEVKCNSAKFHYCRIYVTDFREGAFLATHPWVAPKRSILKRVKSKPFKTNNNANMMLPGLGKRRTEESGWIRARLKIIDLSEI